MHGRSLLFLGLLAGCVTQAEVPEVRTLGATATVAELLGEHAAAAGVNLTYDARTAEVLRGLAVEPVGPAELRTYRVEARSAGASAFAAPELEVPTYEVFQLTYGIAADLVDVLEELMGSAARSPAGPLRILADERLNAVLVGGPAEQVERIRAMIEQLDRPVGVSPVSPSPSATPASSGSSG